MKATSKNVKPQPTECFSREAEVTIFDFATESHYLKVFGWEAEVKLFDSATRSHRRWKVKATSKNAKPRPTKCFSWEAEVTIVDFWEKADRESSSKWKEESVIYFVTRLEREVQHRSPLREAGWTPNYRRIRLSNPIVPRNPGNPPSPLGRLLPQHAPSTRIHHSPFTSINSRPSHR